MLGGCPGDCTGPDARKDTMRLLYGLELWCLAFRNGLFPGMIIYCWFRALFGGAGEAMGPLGGFENGAFSAHGLGSIS